MNMKYVPLYDGDQNVGSAPLITNLDAWDGMRWRFQHNGCHLGVGWLDDSRYYACYSSDWPEGVVRRKKEDGTWGILFRCSDDFGPTALAIVITEEEARKLVIEHRKELFDEMFGEKI